MAPTEIQKLTNQVSKINKFIRNIGINASPKQWLYVNEAEKLTGYSGETLRKMFAAGNIKNRKTSPGGRKVQYLKSELVELFNL